MKLLEFDEEKRAFFNPEDVVERLETCPKTVVTCFAHNLIEYAIEMYGGQAVGNIGSANGDMPLYSIHIDGQTIGLTMSIITAPAVVGQYEELFAMGVENIVVFGTCGVLDSKIRECSIIIPNCAVRDEGTSFHYVKASDEIEVNVKSLQSMIEFFNQKSIHYTVGKVWTTDAIYRETHNKIQKRKDDGCICVEMECAAISALAQFRNKKISQFFYAADNLAEENWDIRSLENHKNVDVKIKILELAIELAINIYH